MSHRFACIIYRIHNAVISHANPPAVFITMQFFATTGSRIAGQFADPRKQPPDYFGWQILQFFFGRRGEGDEVFRHLTLPSARSSASTSVNVKRCSFLRTSDTTPSSMSSASIDNAVAITSSV